MALTDTHTPSIFSAMGSFFKSVFDEIVEARMLRIGVETRRQKIEILNAKTDKELAEMNLCRAEITAFVFRDLMFS